MGKMARETLENDLSRDALRGDWHGYKRVFPVASGGVYPAKVHGNLDGYGIDCIIQAGGGVHGHPVELLPVQELWCRRRMPG
jgi:ribulose-bisphosphate carboxylase large chain